jgi:hypothetical protein
MRGVGGLHGTGAAEERSGVGGCAEALRLYFSKPAGNGKALLSSMAA